MMMTHLQSYEKLVKLMFAHMNLSLTQQHQLINPMNKIMDQKPVHDIAEFLKSAKKLIICGDYDCDGISSTSIAMLLARKLSLQAGYYIPNRFTEGYGVSVNTIQMAHERGYTDVLIIDNGVKAYDAIDLAKSFGMKIAIVDHHLIEKNVDVAAFLHPDVLDDYGSTMCASGLIYCVAEAMGLHDDYMLSLAALGTIADVMPLWNKNRDIVRMGIKALQNNSFKQFDGIVKPGKFTQYSAKTLAFKMVPKINSIGRMADQVNVNTAVSYFISNDNSEISSYIKQVQQLDDYRKALTKKYQGMAEKQISNDPFQVITNPDFHEGLVGIVANKIADMTQKPTVILTEYQDHYKGSARSMSFSLHEIFSQINPDYFEAMGGHDYAFGMTIKRAAFESFKRDLNKILTSMKPLEKEETLLRIDPTLITIEAMNQLREFEPYGEGFVLPKVAIDCPVDYNLVDLRGYGYKYVFKNYPIDEAIYFSTGLTRYECQNTKTLYGTFDLGNESKVVFNIDSID